MRKVTLAAALVVIVAIGCLAPFARCSDYPMVVTDMSGRKLTIEKAPKRIVSVFPSATDVIFAIGADASLVGITYHTTWPDAANNKAIVGGFFRPSIKAIEALKPDLVFCSKIQKQARKHFEAAQVALVEMDTHSMTDAYRMMELVGNIVGKPKEAAELVRRIQGRLARVREKVEKIPANKRKRVMRLMGVDTVMTPGDDSFQNEFIRAAGGIPPSMGKDGPIVQMTQEEWQAFNPQLVYYCGKERRLIKKYSGEPGWMDVAAVREKRFVHFPCELTCRASVHMADFVEWLASVIYPQDFVSPDTAVSEDRRLGSKTIDLKLDYVKSAEIVDSMHLDFTNRTLLLRFSEPMRCLSSLEGCVEDVVIAGNHSLPPPLWGYAHSRPIAELKREVCGAMEVDPGTTSLIFTGALMDSLSVQKRSFKDMTVYALVTAGAESNAVRAGVDSGHFYEAGTINIVLLSNGRLTPRAMARSLITATEAKTAALQDLDVRSSYTPMVGATGTGTDNIIVVEGRGPRLDSAGGHSKLGELIAKAVYSGVRESLAKQNGVVAKRNVFRRMKERKIDVYGIASKCARVPKSSVMEYASQLEGLLLKPRYAGFVEQAFALNDKFERGLINDLSGFAQECKDVREAISCCPISHPELTLPEDFAPETVRMAFESLLNGLRYRAEPKPQ